jgi:uncharacterized protein
LRHPRQTRANVIHPILEGLLTTVDPDGSMHLAPMGPRIDPDGRRLLLRPFPTSHTFRNLKARSEGVLHVTDDVLLLARAALGEALPQAARAAERVNGFVLTGACRFMEFVVKSLDESGERVQIEAEVVHAGAIRDFWGFNRGKHAVLEAAILATRFHLLDLDEVAAEYKRLQTIVEKTGGAAEHEAFAFLQQHLDQARRDRRKP